ncbi:hypothetical protein [Chryseosolibacter indicus]|uniref:DUF1049 domain-containing protein n=1 Tax=Chryseosolibacter indicus TaxID=2782351 RepID=A0ABS5VTN3_9BACT|nr:hypothetical protein [Chryseosolibacter indicus]MBT1704784.1 hypothetical protein [Chryseosolibacter indicus]
MSKNRLIFYIVFGIFHISAFIFTVVLDNNTGILFQMVSWIPAFKWVTLAGLVLLIVDIIWVYASQKETTKEKAILNHELNTLKAKLFDMQEATRQNTGIQQPPQSKTNI